MFYTWLLIPWLGMVGVLKLKEPIMIGSFCVIDRIMLLSFLNMIKYIAFATTKMTWTISCYKLFINMSHVMVGNWYIQGRQKSTQRLGLAELEECLLSIQEALASIPSIAQTRYGSSCVQLGRRIRMSVFKVSLNYKLRSRLIWATSDHVFKKEVGGSRGGGKGKYTQILKSSPKVVALSKSPKHTCKAGFHVKTGQIAL